MFKQNTGLILFFWLVLIFTVQAEELPDNEKDFKALIVSWEGRNKLLKRLQQKEVNDQLSWLQSVWTEGRTPLHFLAQQSRYNTFIGRLLDHVSNVLPYNLYNIVNAQDDYGNTPLMLAVQSIEVYTTAFVLLDYDASPDIANNIGNTPLHIIASTSRSFSFGLIGHFYQMQSTCFNLVNQAGMTPYRIAYSHNHRFICKSLAQHGASCDISNINSTNGTTGEYTNTLIESHSTTKNKRQHIPFVEYFKTKIKQHLLSE